MTEAELRRQQIRHMQKEAEMDRERLLRWANQRATLAGHALQGLIAKGDPYDPESTASRAVVYADAVLAKLNPKSK